MDEIKTENGLQKPVWTVQPRKNYGGKCSVNGTGIPIYTKKQMKSLYPDGKYGVTGEFAPDSTKDSTGTLRCGKNAFAVTGHKTNNRFVYRETGFTAVGEDNYVVILCHALPMRALVFIVCMALLIGGISTALQMRSRDPVPAGTAAVSAPQLESGAVDWEGIKVSEPENTPADGIRIPGFKSITIQADTTEVSVNLQNPEQNNCYFVIRLVLPDTQETLYESKMIEPGKGLYTITLSRALEAGTYPAQLQYEPYDLSTLTRLNGAVINLELIAE